MTPGASRPRSTATIRWRCKWECSPPHLALAARIVTTRTTGRRTTTRTRRSAAGWQAVSTALVGRRLGAYRLVAEIGRGGMGVVYEARRDDEEFDRRVAIKILPAWSGADLADRFRLERRVLAGLDHPGIARLIDSAPPTRACRTSSWSTLTAAIDAWCRERQPDVAARVALIERVWTRSPTRISISSFIATSSPPTSSSPRTATQAARLRHRGAARRPMARATLGRREPASIVSRPTTRAPSRSAASR